MDTVMGEVLKELREIKNLLHTIASSTEQKRVSAAEMAEMLADDTCSVITENEKAFVIAATNQMKS